MKFYSATKKTELWQKIIKLVKWNKQHWERQLPHIFSFVKSMGKMTWTLKGNTRGVGREWLQEGERIRVTEGINMLKYIMSTYKDTMKPLCLYN